MAEKTVFDQLGGTPQTPASQPIQSAPPTSAATGTVFDQLGSSGSGGADLSFGGKPSGGTGTVFDQISSEPNTEGTVFHEDDRYALPGVMAKDANAPWYKLAWDYAWDVPLTEHLGIPAYRQGAGGIERGLEKFATGFTTPANLLLTIATYGAGGFIESAGATVLKESGVLTAEELTQVGAGAKKYVSALQEGYDATKAAEKAGVSPELMQKAVDGLYAHGLNEADMLGRPLTGRITGTFAKAGIPIEKAANVGKFLQAGASIGFSAQQAYGALQAVPAALDAVKEGDYDKALEYATEGTLSGFFAATGGRHALHDADTLLAPLSGGKLKPSEMTGKFLSLFKDRDESVGYANNQMAILQETLRDTLKKHLGRSPNEQEMVDYYTKMTVGEDPELARQMHNALAEAMGDPNRISPTGSSVLHQAHPITKNGNGQLSFGEDMFQQEHDRPLIMKANAEVDPRAKEIADAYEKMQHRPGDPAVRRTYESLKKDIAEQYKYATEKLGIKFEPSGADPYKNSAEMMADVRKNKTLKFFTGGDMPADHPMAEIMPGANITYNDAFRAIHDLYGHAAHGFEFGPRGEENAWNTHRQMFSPASVPALTTETKGQNSWVNFGPHMRDAQGNVRNIGEEGFIPASKRPYAEQKAGILPIEYWYRPDETAVAHHFSNVPGLDVIKTEKYGTNENIKSEDRKRMNEPGFKNRVYLGLDGRFYEHDIQAQRFKYRVPIDLKKFYDIEKDPEGIWAAARKDGATAAENAVEKAGYDGYYSQSQGIVASFKDMPVPQETSGAITTDGIRNSIQKAFPNVPSEQVEGVIALWKTFATSLGQPFAEFVHKNFIRFEHGGEPPASVGEALAQTTVTRAEKFDQLGQYDVKVGDKSYKIYRDPESKMWYEAETGKHFSQAWLGSTKAEAVARLEARSNPPNELAQTGPALESHLTADELAQVNKPNSKISLADVMKKLPPVKEFVEAAKAGAVGAKWYARSQAAFEAMRKLSPEYFKADDADRFAAVVAATSPQQPVAMNLREALTFWKQWHDAGRPLSEQDIAKAQKSGEIEKLANNSTKLPAVIRALNDEEILSGNPDRYMKVTNFARNLSGMMDNVTNDTWMGIFGGIEGRIDKAAVYHAISSHVRAAAEELNISPAEAQASIWVFTKTLAEMAGWKGGENNSRYRPQELLSHLTNDKMAEYSRDFADIMRDDPEVRARLQELKVDVNELDKRLESIPRAATAPVEAASNPHLGKAARRIGEAQQQLAGFGGYSKLPSKTTSFDFGVNEAQPLDSATVAAGGTGALSSEEIARGQRGDKHYYLSPEGKITYQGSQPDAPPQTIARGGAVVRYNPRSGWETINGDGSLLGRFSQKLANAVNPNILFQSGEIPYDATSTRNWNIPEEQRNRAIALYKEGKSVAAVAKEVGIGGTTVHRILKEAGVNRPITETNYASSETKQKALDLYTSGLNTYEVAEELGLGQQTVTRWTREAGVSRGYSGAQALRASLGRTTDYGIKTKFTSEKTGKEMTAGSTYELARMSQLDKDPTVVSFERSKDRIPYGKGQHYNPDLLVKHVDGSFTIEEIKPDYKQNFDDVRAKAEAAKSFYGNKGVDYHLVTEHTIGEDGFNSVDTARLGLGKEEAARVKASLATAKWYVRKFAEREAAQEEAETVFQKGGKSGHVIKGATEFMKDGSAVIRGYKSGDISTLIHETFHVFRRHIPQVETQLAEKIYGVQNGQWTREQEEKFAEDGTKYVHEGKSPIPEMDGVFAKLKTWLSDLYHKLMSSPSADDILPSEKRQLFDRIFGARGTDREYSHPSMPDNIRELMARKAVDPQQGNMLREAYKRVHQNKFSDVENNVMKQVREKMASGYEFAHNRGIIRQAVDNYLPRIFEKQNPSGNAVSSEARQGKFATSATYARHRVFQSELEASLLGNRFAAFDPIALMGKWHGDIQRIAANRELLDKLREGGVRGSDGRPAVALSGMGRVAEGPNGENPVTMVHPNRIRNIKISPSAVEGMKKSGELDRRLESGDIEEINTHKGDTIYVWRPQDYESMNHQAFRGWNYVTSDPSGHPVMMDAEMKVHPEYAKYLKRRLGLDDSPLRNWAPTRGLLKAGTEAKHLMLSFSPFHMFQEGLRGIMMGVNPFLSERVDFSKDSRLRLLMRNGATLETDHASLADHSEGLASHSKILSKVPIIGKSLDWYQHFLFERYIPSLKARTGVKLYEQYRSMHPDWTKDMAASHAAHEINDVFGGQNWREMGRATATQDWFRILALAPDWLESEARFAARLFSPTEGVIARKQTVKLALGLWGVSRVLNMMMTGKPHYEAPFGIVRKDDDGREKVYSMRTLPTDIMHMASDPIGFVRGRMSPFAHAATEAWTGRDQFGKKLSPGDLTADIFANMSPIPLQTVAKKSLGMSTPPTTNSDQVVKASGLTVTPYRTQAQKLAAELSSNRNESGPVDPAKLARHQAIGEFQDKLRSGRMQAEDLHSMVEIGQMSPKEAKDIIKNVNETKELDPEAARFYMRAARLPMDSLLEVWEKSTGAERVVISKLLHKRAMNYFKKAAVEESPEARLHDPVYRKLRLLLPQVQPF